MFRYALKLITYSSIILFGIFNNVFASIDSNNQKIIDLNSKLFLNADKIYIPSEYKSGDAVTLVITGYLPSLCYKDVSSEFEIIPSTHTIKIKLWSNGPDINYNKNIICAQIIRPYLHKINLGEIEKGSYSIEINKDTNFAVEKKLIIDDEQIIISL
ncbi:MAG: hypothetical protein HQK53_03445 [Oligoflexia bacterium]|nr:hypothetical protein [Oligoflexia bacterium]